MDNRKRLPIEEPNARRPEKPHRTPSHHLELHQVTEYSPEGASPPIRKSILIITQEPELQLRMSE